MVEAADGQQAINLANRTVPDILLIDLRLPRVSAAVVIRQIRNQAQLCRHRLIIISLSNAGRKKSSFSLSAEHLEKPVEFDQLISLIDRLLAEAQLVLTQACSLQPSLNPAAVAQS